MKQDTFKIIFHCLNIDENGCSGYYIHYQYFSKKNRRKEDIEGNVMIVYME